MKKSTPKIDTTFSLNKYRDRLINNSRPGTTHGMSRNRYFRTTCSNESKVYLYNAQRMKIFKKFRDGGLNDTPIARKPTEEAKRTIIKNDIIKNIE